MLLIYFPVHKHWAYVEKIHEPSKKKKNNSQINVKRIS